MALPKLNTPTHELVLPSTGEKIKYRPFLVKEQKILMLAQESEDELNVANTIGDLITTCTFEKVNGHESPMFDVEFIFLKLRAKSVGETAEISVLAKDDNKTKVPVKVNLAEIDVHMTADHTNEVTLNETTKLVMKYPRLKDMKGIPEGTSDFNKMFFILNKCIAEIHYGDKIYNRADTSEKDIQEFVDQMNTEQFQNVVSFFETMPRLRHEIQVTNPKTKVESTVLLEGLQSFLG